jgi:glycerol-3-phosphate dehydrogenase
VEDVLARRSRLLFLDARLAASIAPRVAVIIEQELGRDAGLAAFQALALQYLPRPQ